MDFRTANTTLGGIPYTGTRKGKFLYELVCDNGIHDIRELGFAHGVATLYMAAAIDETKRGRIDSVDLEDSAIHPPTLEELARKLRLISYLNIHREKSSYTWFLKKIEEQTEGGVCEPCYDLIFIDGPKDWTVDGAAFFMADKLLRPGGWMMFDDFYWSYRQHEQQSGAVYTRGYVWEHMSEDEFAAPHVEAVFRLLVQQHPAYSHFRVVDDTLGLAQKVEWSDSRATMKVETSLTASYIAFITLRSFARANES